MNVQCFIELLITVFFYSCQIILSYSVEHHIFCLSVLQCSVPTVPTC
jgi:hypothetical protein